MDETWCTAREGDGMCPAPVASTKPVPLCRAHQLEVAMQIVPGVLAECWGEARVDLKPPERLIAEALPLRIPEILPNGHASVVYFVENGSRIKIGVTTNLARRLSRLTLRPASVRLLLAGGTDLEAALHRHFDQSRVPKTEWFGASRELVAFMRRKLQSPTTGELVEVADDAAPVERPEAERVRALVWEHIEALGRQGEVAVGAKDFVPLMPLLGRSRPWLVGELQRLVGIGRLSQVEPGRYLITATPTEDPHHD